MNADELRQYLRLLRTHPQQYLRIAEDTIRQYPDDPESYLDCVTAWMRFDQYDYALADIDTALSLADSCMTRWLRGIVLRCQGRYRDAIDELNRTEKMDSGKTLIHVLNIDRAACYARLGNLEAALADCAGLPEDYCMPGLHGAPGGTKSQITQTIRRLSAEAKQSEK